MEAYETIMSSTRAPFSILPRPVDADGNTVTTTGGADEDRYPLVPEETTIVAIWLQLLNKAGLNPRSVLWNKVKLLEPLVVLGHDAFNELTQAVTAHYEETKTEDEEGMLSSSETHYIAMNHLMYATMSYLALKVKYTEKITRVTDSDSWEEWEDNEEVGGGSVWVQIMSTEWFEPILEATRASATIEENLNKLIEKQQDADSIATRSVAADDDHESGSASAVGSGRLPDLPSDDKAQASEILLILQLYLEFGKKEKSIAKLMQACSKNTRIKQRLLTWNAHNKNDAAFKAMQQHERFDAFITVLIEESDKSRDMDSALIDLQKVKQGSKQHFIKYITELENKLETYLTACAAENVKPEAQHEGRGKVEYMIRNLNSLFKKELARSMRAANMRKDTVTYKWARDECMEIDKMLLENNELSDDSEGRMK